MSTDELILLGVIDYNEAKRIRFALEEQGVRLELISNPETCPSGGCQPKVEVFTRTQDLEKVQLFFKREKERSLEGLEVPHGFEEFVFDADKESANCPACGTHFSTQLKECPDCGLVFVFE